MAKEGGDDLPQGRQQDIRAVLLRPTFKELPIPDAQVLQNKASRAELNGALAEAIELTTAGWGVDPVRAMLKEILPRVLTDPAEVISQTAQAVGRYAHLGYALAEVERRRGWARDGFRDGRIWTALVMSFYDETAPTGTLGVLAIYMGWAGYWIGRQGPSGLDQLVAFLPRRAPDRE